MASGGHLRPVVPLAQLLLFNQPEAIAAAGDQAAVVRHQQHRAGELLQRLRQLLFACHIQMVGRFIQQQQRITRQRQADKQQARALTTAEGGNLLLVAQPRESLR